MTKNYNLIRVTEVIKKKSKLDLRKAEFGSGAGAAHSHTSGSSTADTVIQWLSITRQKHTAQIIIITYMILNM